MQKTLRINLLFQILYRRQSKNKKHLPVTIEPTIKALRYVIVGTNSKKVVIVFLEKKLKCRHKFQNYHPLIGFERYKKHVICS